MLIIDFLFSILGNIASFDVWRQIIQFLPASAIIYLCLTNIRNIFKLMHDIAASQNIVLFCLIDIFMFATSLSDCAVTFEEITCDDASIDTQRVIECSSTKGSLFGHKRSVSNSSGQKTNIVISVPTFATLVHHQIDLALNSLLLRQEVSYCILFNFQGPDHIIETF